MKQCPECKQMLGEAVRICPACGADAPAARARIGRFALLELVNETAEWCAFRGRAEGETEDRLVRVLNPGVAMDDGRAARLRSRIGALAGAASPYLVAHEGVEQDADGTWFVVSEWVDCVGWGDVVGERLFRDPPRKRVWVDLFGEMAAALDALHQTGQIAPNLKQADFLPVRRPDGSYGVKLDCSLSPFLRSSAASALAPNHPDAKAGRALDARSDIHSLGTIFLDLASGRENTPAGGYPALIEEIMHRFEPIVLHRKLGALFKAMVDDNPDGRPSSAASVRAKLAAVTDHDIAKWIKFEKDPVKGERVVRRVRWSVAAAAAITLLVTGIMFRSAPTTEPDFEGLYEDLKHSTVFVLVELWEESEGRREMIGGSSGTAFLVSEDGYLLSNRHVVCPWLEDEAKLDAHFRAHAAQGVNATFGYTLYLWFEGETAFRPRGTGDSIEEQYRIDTAYSSAPGSSRQVELVGVMPLPTRLGEARRALEDDVAVLKVCSVPEGALPIPLASQDAGSLRPATPVMAIGFPDGRGRIEGTQVVANRTIGAVTSVFSDMFGINASLYSGNSGGPVVDRNGRAVGIATAVFMGSTTIMDQQGQRAQFRTSAPDAGRVLPIARAAGFLEGVRSGRPAWKGLPEFAYRRQLEQAKAAATKGDWAEAARVAAHFPDGHGDPDLLFWTALLSAEPEAAAQRARALDDAVAIHPAHFSAHFLRYCDDWQAGVKASARRSREVLLGLDWRSHGEFFATAVRLIEEATPAEEAAAMAETGEELAILNWVSALAPGRAGDGEARKRLLEIAHGNVAPDTPFAFLIRHAMDVAGIPRETSRPTPERLSAADAKEQMFREIFKALQQGTVSPDRQPGGEAAPTRFERAAYAGDAFRAVGMGNWDMALDRAEHFLADAPDRQSAQLLRTRLLHAQIRHRNGDSSALKALAESEGWYAETARLLMVSPSADPAASEKARQELAMRAGEDAHRLLTLDFALALAHDMADRPAPALTHYRNARDTLLMNRPEHAAATQRIRMLGGTASRIATPPGPAHRSLPSSDVEPPFLAIRYSADAKAPVPLREAAQSFVGFWERKANGVILPEQDPAVRRTHDIYARMLRVADKRGKYLPTADSLRVVNTGGDPWAMALPSGHIVLSRQALDVCFDGVSAEEGDARMAFVLGHELGHLAADDFRHAQAYLAFGNTEGVDQEILRTLRKGGDAARVFPDKDTTPQDRARAAETARAAELHADDSGFLYAAAAGFRVDLLTGDGEERLSFFEHWTSQIAHRIEDSHHPEAGTRAAFLRARLQRLSDFIALFDAGVVCLALGSYDAALPLFEAYQKVFPSREVFNNMGLCYLRRARPFGLAELGLLDHTTRARQLGAHLPVALLDAPNQPDEATLRDLRFAAACFEHARASDATYLPARINFAMISLLDGGARFQEALAALDEVYVIQPQHPLANLTAALLRARFERYPEDQATALRRLAEAMAKPEMRRMLDAPGTASADTPPLWLLRHTAEVLVRGGHADVGQPILRAVDERLRVSASPAGSSSQPTFAAMLGIELPIRPGAGVPEKQVPRALNAYRTVPFQAGFLTAPDHVFVREGEALVVAIDQIVHALSMVCQPAVALTPDLEQAARSRIPLGNGDAILLGSPGEALLTREGKVLEYWQSISARKGAPHH